MRTMLHSTWLVAAILAATSAVAQQPFGLDASFRTSIHEINVSSILPLSDGKIIVSGRMRFPGEMEDKRLARLLPNGQRDETFNNSGLGGGDHSMAGPILCGRECDRAADHGERPE
ncbi:MAG: delta-60 repeat domain-containing protein [Flavobacteriales bacterium]|nr:delta-60 repeat domain-containing protein [Flavobacteriales bacterium]